MHVPMNDLLRYLSIKKPQLLQAASDVIDSGHLINGENVKGFEKEFAKFLGCKAVIGVANGSDALELALRAAGVGKGQNVILAPNAGMYAMTALNLIGANPYFVDIDESSFSIDAEKLRLLVTGSGIKFSAVVVTHLYGFANPQIAVLAQICSQNGITLIEDCAQAHGASVSAKRVGTFGRLSTFSFYPTKNLGAIGDGGAVVVNEDGDEVTVRRLAQYGWDTKYIVVLENARNSRLDELQAAFLRILLPELEERNSRRLHIAGRYQTEIKNPRITLPTWDFGQYVAHLFVVRVEASDRDSFAEHLSKHGISTDVHYPLLDPEQPILVGKQNYLTPPNAKKINAEIVSLPCFPELTPEEVSKVIEACNAW